MLPILVASTTWVPSIANAQQPEGVVVPWSPSPDFHARTPLFTAIAAGVSHYLGLTRNGTVIATAQWDPLGYTTVPSGLSNVIAIAAGDNLSLALKRDGTVVAWGWNSDGQAIVPIGLTNVIAIAAGDRHCLALKRDGTVVAWGDSAWYQASVPPGLSSVISIAGGPLWSYAVKQDGTVVAWGWEATVPSGLSNVIAISTSGDATLALKHDRTLVGWGPHVTVPNGLTGVVAIAAGPNSMALKQDGTVVSMGLSGNSALAAPKDAGKVIAINGGYALVDLAPSNARSTRAVQTVEVGSQPSYAAQADGTPPFIYQWLFNETNTVSVSTNSVLALSNIQPTQAGAYSVHVVSTAYGETFSPQVWVSVIPAVERSTFPVLQLTGDLGSTLHLSYSDVLGPGAVWRPLDTVTLTNSPQPYFDPSEPPLDHRFYRASQTNLPNVLPALQQSGFVTQITLTGVVGGTVRIDYINAVGPTNDWVTLNTVVLTNTPQLYFDLSMFGRPPRLYRVVPLL